MPKSDELSLVIDLLAEQEPGTIDRAKSDPRGIAMTFLARGDYLALFVARSGAGAPPARRYVCQILEVVDCDTNPRLLPFNET